MTAQELKQILSEYHSNANDEDSEQFTEFLGGCGRKGEKYKVGELEIEYVKDSDNCNDGAEVETILKVGDQYFSGNYYYTSWDGQEYMDIVESLVEVRPVEEIVIVYKPI